MRKINIVGNQSSTALLSSRVLDDMSNENQTRFKRKELDWLSPIPVRGVYRALKNQRHFHVQKMDVQGENVLPEDVIYVKLYGETFKSVTVPVESGEKLIASGTREDDRIVAIVIDGDGASIGLPE